MIPPCDTTILENNPQFKKLYTNLTVNLLNPDGSTRVNDALPARRVVLEELQDCRTRIAKKQLKKQVLRQVAFDPDNGLPDDLRDTVTIVSLYLDSSPNGLDADDGDRDGASALSLLAPDIETFYSELPAVMPPFSKTLSSYLRDLHAIANVGDTTTSTAPEPPRTRLRARQAAIKTPETLAPQLQDRLRTLRHKELSEAPAARIRMAATAAEVLSTRAAVLERTVMLLERAKHGALARATKAKAEHLATVAHGVEGKLNVMKLDIAATIYTPETTAALHRYDQHLYDIRERLEERQAAALEDLKAYEEETNQANSGPMKEITQKYGDLVQKIEDTKAEIERMHCIHNGLERSSNSAKMADEALSIYDEIEIEDMTFDPVLQIYHYPCPCGDRFEIAIDDLRDGEEIAVCPSCSLMIKVIFDMDDLAKDDKQGGAGAVPVQA
ncbi:zf-CSL-domain-containing protein [Aspergillus avenaceus]|uniref:Diphthamide biosynthesis protein 3 n=1 Tax=Aspergillus avenaceus TaxID=36643 RepID=A0A5N6TM60_ASPAV|nr:zf-CSL-domain-containing protein [Aspergillus avenaceus]